MADDHGATVRQWTDVLRRTCMVKSTKLVGFLLATYADSNGTRIFPGVARVSVECGLTYNMTQAAMAELRSAGLIEVVRQAARRGESDEYRLVLAPDLMERIEVRSPAEILIAIEALRTQRRGKVREKRGPESPEPHPTDRGADPVENGHLHPSKWGAPEKAAPHLLHSNHRPAPHLLATCTPVSDPPPSTDLDTRTTDHSDSDLETASSGPRASPAEASKSIVDCGCTKGYLYANGTLSRCPDCGTEPTPSRPPDDAPPSNVILFRRRTA